MKLLFLIKCSAPLSVLLSFIIAKIKNIFVKKNIKIKKNEHKNFIKNKKITEDYFSSHAFNFNEILKTQNKNFQYLEIGSFEGNSTIFIAKNFPLSKISCVDTWIKTEEYDKDISFTNIEKNFDNNIEEFNNIEKFKMSSDEFFVSNSKKFDIIYVDGYHYGPQVYKDVYNSWKILNNNGYLFCDDYIWNIGEDINLTPCFAINKFLSEINNYKIHKVSNSQIFIKKIL